MDPEIPHDDDIFWRRVGGDSSRFARIPDGILKKNSALKLYETPSVVMEKSQ